MRGGAHTARLAPYPGFRTAPKIQANAEGSASRELG